MKHKIYSNSVQVSLFSEYDDKLIEDDYKLYKDAFEWAFEFPEILGENGEFLGFDCIIGNPPYGADLDRITKDYCKKKYEDVHMRTPDTYMYFISLAERLVKANGPISYIVPNNLLFQNECAKARYMFLTKNTIREITNIGDNAFEDASVPTCIFYVSKERNKEYSFIYRDYRYEKLSEINWENHKIKLISNNDVLNLPSYVIGVDKTNLDLINKISKKSITVNDIAKEVAAGISTGSNEAFIVSNDAAYSSNLEMQFLKPIIVGNNVNKYSIKYFGDKIIYSTRKAELDKQPHIFEHLQRYKSTLEKRGETKQGLIPWWCIHRPRYVELFEQDKIVIRQTADHIIATFDKNNYYILNSLLTFEKVDDCDLDYYFLTGVLNSKVNDFIYKNLNQEAKRAFAEVKPNNVRKLVIPKMAEDKRKIISNIVMSIIEKKNEDENYNCEDDENNINRIMYEFYELTENEIKAVESIFTNN